MIHEFNIFKPYSAKLKCGFTDKKMGSFKEDDPDFEKNITNLNLGHPVLANQVHSDIILEVNEIPRQLPDADSFITNQKDLLLMVKVADCQGVIIYDPVQEAIAVAHSGWKGSAKNIIGKTVQKMRESFGSDPKDLKVGISPSLGPCSSEFTDPEKELPAFIKPFFLPENHVDFWKLSMKQLRDAGISADRIENAEICTQCGSDYYSFRNGHKQRFGVFAKLI